MIIAGACWRANLQVVGVASRFWHGTGSRAADDKARFTFRGEPKPSVVPDAPPMDMAKSGEE